MRLSREYRWFGPGGLIRTTWEVQVSCLILPCVHDCCYKYYVCVCGGAIASGFISHYSPVFPIFLHGKSTRCNLQFFLYQLSSGFVPLLSIMLHSPPTATQIQYMEAHIKDNLKPAIIISNTICLTAAYIGVTMRFISRFLIQAGFKADDWLILAALVNQLGPGPPSWLLTSCTIGVVYRIYTRS